MAKAARTPAQNREMWGLVAELGRASGLGRDEITDTVLRTLAREVSGQEHTSHLSAGEADQILAKLRREVGKYSPRPRDPRPGAAPHKAWGPRGAGTRDEQPITVFQRHVVTGLFGLCGKDTERERVAFTQRQCKAPWAQTQAHADALITPLSAMAMRRAQPLQILERVRVLHRHAALDDWQMAFVDDLLRQFGAAQSTGSLDTVLTPHKLIKILEAEARVAGAGRTR